MCARFCAKEAFFKALGTGVSGKMALKDVEVVKEPSGKPAVVLHGATKEYCSGLGLGKINLSITHTSETAMAFVVLENE